MSARLDCGTSILRHWQDSDRASLVRFANDRNIWRNLKDRFPHPYMERDADAWLAVGELGLMRLEAPVFAWNPDSMRVLEKCGFVREGMMTRASSRTAN